MNKQQHKAKPLGVAANTAEQTPDEREVHFITPMYGDVTEPLDLSKLCLDDEVYEEASEEQTAQDEEEMFTRGRSRSRSVHANDVGVGESLIPPIPGKVADSDRNNVKQNSEAKTEKNERTGPLPNKEIQALKKGLEEATQSLNRNQTQEEEEEEERVAADVEKRKRLMGGKAQASTATEEVALRRVKILMLGDSGVGKSSLVNRWTLDSYKPSLTSTVGVNFKSKKVKIRDEYVQVQVWDTAGQEQFHKITTSYYKGAQAIMLVYDVSDIRSLDGIEYWVKNIKSHASDTVQVVLVGNKIDLRHCDPNVKYVETDMGKDVAAKFGIPFFETSAKDSSNVNDAFCTLAEHTIHATAGSGARGKHHFPLLTSTTSPTSGVLGGNCGGTTHLGSRPSIEASVSKMLGSIPHLLSRDSTLSSAACSPSTISGPSAASAERRGVGLGSSPNNNTKKPVVGAVGSPPLSSSGASLTGSETPSDNQKPSFNSLSPADKEKCIIS